MRNPTTLEMCATPSEVNECLARHYETLARDPHLVNARIQVYHDVWRRRYGARDSRPNIDSLDAEISIGEMIKALKRLKTHKAPGIDGIPSEMLKLAASAPKSCYCRALLGVINHIWRSCNILEQWRSAVVV